MHFYDSQTKNVISQNTIMQLVFIMSCSIFFCETEV